MPTTRREPQLFSVTTKNITVTLLLVTLHIQKHKYFILLICYTHYMLFPIFYYTLFCFFPYMHKFKYILSKNRIVCIVLN